MIIYKTGNILDSDAEALVNPVNCVGVMGKGLALQFKNKFPENYIAYRDHCKVGYVNVGKMFITTYYTNPKFIVNFPTKKHWKDPSKYDYIESGLEDLVDFINSSDVKSIAIPALGSGLGGLDWNIVKSMIVNSLVGIEDLIVYLYEK